MNKISVLIADDHRMFREGIKQILELEKDIVVVAEAGNGEEVIKLTREIKPDIVLMDINMPGTNGLQAIKAINDENGISKIIVLTIHDDREYLFRALNMGAQGYVLKDTESQVLIDAIRSIYKGESFIQPNMTKELVHEFNRVTLYDKPKDEVNNLTAREIEVLELVAEGMINKEIAKTLYISEKTVKNHVSNIFKKLHVSDRTQAAIYAYKHNIKK